MFDPQTIFFHGNVLASDEYYCLVDQVLVVRNSKFEEITCILIFIIGRLQCLNIDPVVIWLSTTTDINYTAWNVD